VVCSIFPLNFKCCMCIICINRRWCFIVGKEGEGSCLDQDLNSGLNFSQQKSILQWVTRGIAVNGPLGRLTLSSVIPVAAHVVKGKLEMLDSELYSYNNRYTLCVLEHIHTVAVQHACRSS